MEKPIITSLSNLHIKQARALRLKKARLETGLFLVEGIHHVGEAIAAGWDVESLLYAPELLNSDFGRELVSGGDTKPQPVSAKVIESLADKENPQGIIAVVHQKVTTIGDLKAVGKSKKYIKCAALVCPQDPGNVGTILRTLDAVDADALFLLDGGVELYHPTVVRSSMGALFWKPVVQASFEEFVTWVRAGNYQLIGTSARGSVEYQTFIPDLPWALVLGNEQKGLSAEQIRACDVSVSLPMKGRISSLNLAVAAGVLLYQFAQNAYVGSGSSCQ